VETVPVSPGADYVWIPGAYTWGDNHWVWGAGRWDRPPHPGMAWTPHRYEHRGDKHYYHQGGWH
jgi:hypothetical protein